MLNKCWSIFTPSIRHWRSYQSFRKILAESSSSRSHKVISKPVRIVMHAKAVSFQSYKYNIIIFSWQWQVWITVLAKPCCYTYSSSVAILEETLESGWYLGLSVQWPVILLDENLSILCKVHLWWMILCSITTPLPHIIIEDYGRLIVFVLSLFVCLTNSIYTFMIYVCLSTSELDNVDLIKQTIILKSI